MNNTRVVFVSPRFWPRWDGVSHTLGLLAAALVERGYQATVLTVLEHPDWPARIEWRGVSVVRLPYDRTSRREERRYLKSLAQWLRANRTDFDLAYVSSLRREADAVMTAISRDMPVVLRVAATGRRGDCLWVLDAAGGRQMKRRMMKAAALIGPSRAAQRELIAAGYARDRIYYLPHGVELPPPRDDTSRNTARRTLAETDAKFMLADEITLALYVGRLESDRGLAGLVAAWENGTKDCFDTRLWLVGEGSWQTHLQEQIDLRGLDNRIVMVGHFDQVDMLLAAADFFVLPGADENLSVALLEAMAAGLPAAVCDTRVHRELIEDQHQGLLVTPGDCEAMENALTQLIDRPEWARQLGRAARDQIEQNYSLAKMVESHVMLFEELLS